VRASDIVVRLPFVTFEGSEGCGKSTQVRHLTTRLEKTGVPVLVTREPGGTPLGESIRDLLQFAPQSKGMTPETELLLFEASRAQLVRDVIKPALDSGKCVIADRFFDSTAVYQGVARKLDKKIVRQLNAFAVGDCIPDITFFLDVDLPAARARMKGPRRPDRMEQQPDKFYEDVIEAYRALAKREPNRVVRIDGSASPGEIENDIWQTLCKRFPALNKSKM
jgi:dTMP kinase